MSLSSITRLLPAGAGVLLSSLRLFAADPQVPRWQPRDIEFESRTPQSEPFRVPLSADLTGPGGNKRKVPGFYDGEQKWKVRVSLDTVGQWTLTTHSTVPDLDQRRVSLQCVANASRAIHGSLQVDAAQPHHFVFQDGTRFFPMGYECDWLWALDTGDPELKTINPFLDKIADHGFNFIIMNAFAYDTTWRKGRTGADDFGPPPLHAWAGNNDQPDFSQFNLPYWQHFDRVVEAMARRGLVIHLFIKVYNKKVTWPANGSPEDDLYFRWLIARYAAYPNMTWDVAKEAQYEKNLEYKQGRLQFMRDNDPYRRLLTVHDDRANYDRGAYDGLADYRSDQQHKQWREVMLAHLKQRAWPVVNTEFSYEHGPAGISDKTYSGAQPPAEVCRRAWEIVLAGGSIAYYYTYTAWDVVRPQDTPPGYVYLKQLRQFFETTKYWRLQPAEGVTGEGDCLAEPGREYVVFLNAAKPFTLKLTEPTATFRGKWFHPLTGKWDDAGAVSSGTIEMKPPPDSGNDPVALHLSRVD